MKTTTEPTTDDKVAALLAQNGILYTVRHVRATTRKQGTDKPWECDRWAVELTHGARTAEFDYFTGTGHRQPPIPMPKPPYTPGTIAHEDWTKRSLRPVPPSAAGVLYSILSDSDAVGQSFESWCADLGMNPDSIQDEQTYRECQKNADKLASVVPAIVRAELSKLLEDY